MGATLVYFDGFVDWFNNDMGTEDLVVPVNLGLDESFSRHFAQHRQKPGVRMSSLGKPAIITALQKLGYFEPEPKGKLKYIFFQGDVFENVLGTLLENYGHKVVVDQTANPEDTLVEWNGVTGHYDFIVNVGGQDVLVEAKTMSGNYSRTFKDYPDDDRGYVTQLALYAYTTGLPCTWLCYDKNASEMFEVVPDPLLLASARERAERVVKRLGHVNTIEDVFQYFRPPPGRNEVFQKQESGRLLIPQSMAWSPYKSVVYKLSEEPNGYNKPTNYIHEYADAEHAQKELDFLVDNGVLYKEK